MSNEVLNSLLKEYEQKKLKAEMDLDKRKSDLYNKIPELQKIEIGEGCFGGTSFTRNRHFKRNPGSDRRQFSSAAVWIPQPPRRYAG